MYIDSTRLTTQVACESMRVSQTQILSPVQEYKNQRVSFTAILYFELSSLHLMKQRGDETRNPSLLFFL